MWMLGKIIYCLIIPFILVNISFADVPEISRPILKIMSTEKPPRIDGKLDDECWKTSSVAGGFITKSDQWADQQTAVFVAYDEKNIYIACHCYESNMAVVGPLPWKFNLNDNYYVYGIEGVEVCFDVANKSDAIHKIAVTFDGNVFDAILNLENFTSTRSWNSGCKTAIGKGENGWFVEIALPFKDLCVEGPKKGETWGFNVNRRRHIQPNEFSSWAMSAKPYFLGKLVFGESDAISVWTKISHDKTGKRNFDVNIRNHCQRELYLRVTSDVCCENKTANSSGQVILKPFATDTIAGLKTISRNEITSESLLDIVVSDINTRRIYYSREAFVETIDGFTVVPDRFYYSPDSKKISVSLCSDKGKRIELKLGHDAKATPLFTTTILLDQKSKKYNISIPIEGLNPGRYVVTTILKDDDGKNLLAKNAVVYKRNFLLPLPLPENIEKITFADSGAIMINGKPFCPIIGTHSAIQPPFVKNVFNVNWGNFALVPGVFQRGWCHVFTFLPKQVSYVFPTETDMPKFVKERIASLKNQTNILDVHLGYESNLPLFRDKQMSDLIETYIGLKKVNNAAKKVLPGVPTTVQIDLPEILPEIKNSVDIIELACPLSSYSEKIVRRTAKDAAWARKILGNKPFLFFIGSSLPNSTCHTADTIRCASYQVLMHGANGIVYHMGHAGIQPGNTRHWSVYEGLAREIECLYPIICSSEKSNISAVTTSAKGLDICARRYRGKEYIIICNTNNATVYPKINVKSDTTYRFAKLPLESRELKVDDNSFNDEFTPYETHIYELIPRL